MKIKFILFALLLISNTMFAQLKPYSDLYTADFGMSMLKGTESNSNLNGYNFHFVYDSFSSNTSLTSGFTIGYMKANEEYVNNEIVYTTVPVLLQGKYFPTAGRNVYLQFGAGVHFSKAEYIGPNRNVFVDDSGFIVLAGVGSLISIDKDLFLNVAYNFNWLDSQSYQNGIMHTIKIGLAFN